MSKSRLQNVTVPADVVKFTNEASATASGIVSTGAQTFAGTKTFANAIEYKNGTAFKFSFAGTPTANRTITMPDASGTVALLNTANVFTANQKAPKFYAGMIGMDTASGSDIGVLEFCPGNITRKPYISIHGMQHATLPGVIYIDAGSITFANLTGNFQCGRVYNVGVTNTPRVVNVDSNGVFGYVSSVRASKNKIDYKLDTSFLYDLKPVSFEYRLRNEAGEWLEETDGHQKIGLIAEDVDLVKPEMTYKSTEGVLEGVDYQYLIPALLKEIQNLNKRLKVLEEALNV